MEDYQVVIIVVLSIVLLGLLLYLLTPKEHPIDVIKDRDGTILFKVYARGTTFGVVDYTKKYNSTKVTILFRSYIEVEAYISKRFNGWDNVTNT